MPTGHGREVFGARRFSHREKWIIRVGVGMIVVLAVVVAISFTSTQRKSQNGCIDVSAATVIGGSELYRCGEAARDLCSTPSGPGAADNISFRTALADACRKAGLPVPSLPDGT
ncbi:MAG TPA: hypothetical protein VGF93_06920 [Solirubrobacteraceae bacterium]